MFVGYDDDDWCSLFLFFRCLVDIFIFVSLFLLQGIDISETLKKIRTGKKKDGLGNIMLDKSEKSCMTDKSQEELMDENVRLTQLLLEVSLCLFKVFHPS